MKKSLLFLTLAALMLPTALRAQNVIWSYDFSDSLASVTDWTLYDSDGDSYTWEWNGEDSSMLGYVSHDHLVSPAITIPASATNAKLTYMSYQMNLTYQGQEYAPGYLVMISTTTADTSAFTDTVYYEYQNQHGWAMQSIDLGAYAGQTIYVCFFIGAPGYTWIDNLMVYTPDCPAIELPWTETFAQGVDCWTNIDYDGDSYGWTGGQQGGAASNSYINGVGSLTPDNWLVSSAISLPAGEGYTLSWSASGANNDYPAEHYAVYVATTNTVDGFLATTAVHERTLTSASWEQNSVDISGFAGQTVYVAFRHFNCENQFVLTIGEVSITVGGGTTGIADVDNSAISLYPNPASSMVEVSAQGVEGRATVAIVDLNGRTLMQQDGNAASYRFDVSGLAAGAYFVRMTGENVNAVQKLIVK